MTRLSKESPGRVCSQGHRKSETFFNSNIQESEAGGLQVGGQPGLYREVLFPKMSFQAKLQCNPSFCSVSSHGVS